MSAYLKCIGRKPRPREDNPLALALEKATPSAGVKGVSPWSIFSIGAVEWELKECKSAGLDTRHSLTYNERAHKQNIIYGCATAMIYLFSIALNTIEVLQSIKG